MKIDRVTDRGGPKLLAGQTLSVIADVSLGGLGPGDVTVEAYFGKLHGAQSLHEGATRELVCTGEAGAGQWRFEGTIPAGETGGFAFAVRVFPRNEALAGRFASRLLSWQG